MAVQPGFFDLSDRYEALSAAGDPLERLGCPGKPGLEEPWVCDAANG